MSQVRENWGSRIGIILAVAGSAIGLGNFLRFPVKAAVYGGGAFLIPYFISFVVIGIPLAWMEWTIGRYGGLRGLGSEPSALGVFSQRKWARYLGSLGVLAPALIYFYYVYIESWLLGFFWFTLDGSLSKAVSTNTVSQFFGNYISLQTTIFGVPSAIIFFCITFIVNFLITSAGITKGIEKFNKVALPLVLILGFVLMIRVITLPGIEKGFAFLWNPDFSRIGSPRTWLEASGQIFFTLSLGMASIVAYASYCRKKDDITLSSLTANATNEFAEVILGGTIVVPLAIVIFGADVQTIAKLGTFGLAFNTLPIIFSKITLGALFQAIWFLLLFFAAITSSIGLIQPVVTFLEDELSMTRKKANLWVVGISVFFCFLVIFGLDAGVLDECDFWGGTFLLVVVATIEAIVFSWVFGIDKAWEEMHHGARLKVPVIFKFIMKYITPTYLIVILVTWLITDYKSAIFLTGVDPKATAKFLSFTVSKIGVIIAFRCIMIASLVAIIAVLFFAGKKRDVLNAQELSVKE